MVTKNQEIIFFDLNDKKQFQMVIDLSEIPMVYQTNIWWLNFHRMWLTTDQTNNLYKWNIETEKVEFTVKPDYYSGSITDLCELVHLKVSKKLLPQEKKLEHLSQLSLQKNVGQLVAIVSSDKKITIMSFFKQTFLMKIDVQLGLHSIIYNEDYRLIITAGYSMKVQLYQLDSVYYDYQKVSELEGHQSLITGISNIRGTSILATVDEQGYLKLWDLKNFQCYQTIELGQQKRIKHIIYSEKSRKIGFLGKKFYVMQFISSGITETQDNSVSPIRIEVDAKNMQMIVFTVKDLRFFDLTTGKLQKIIRGSFENDESTVTACKTINNHMQFVLGNSFGKVKQFNIQRGENLHELRSHKTSVQHIFYDDRSRQFISTSSDGSIKVQQLINKQYVLKRRALACNQGKPFSDFFYSQYHGLFASSESEGGVGLWIWDSQNLRPMVNIRPSQETEIMTSVQIIEGYRLISALSSLNRLYLYKLHQNWTIELLEEVQLPGDSLRQSPITQKILFSADEDSSLTRIIIFVGFSGGLLATCYLEIARQDLLEPLYKSPQYNPDKNIDESFETLKESAAVFKIEPLEVKSSAKIQSAQAHTQSILQIETLQNMYKQGNICIVSASSDKCIRIWRYSDKVRESLKRLANLNINHPLPIQFELEISEEELWSPKIHKSLSILESLADMKDKKSRRKAISTLEYLHKITGKLRYRCVWEGYSDEEPEQRPKTVMKNHFEVRDLRQEESQRLYAKELQGVSLKQMQQKKSYQRERAKIQKLEEQYQSGVAHQDSQKQLHQKRENDMKESLAYLNQGYRSSLDSSQRVNASEGALKLFSQKLSQHAENVRAGRSIIYKPVLRAPETSSNANQQRSSSLNNTSAQNESGGPENSSAKKDQFYFKALHKESEKHHQTTKRQGLVSMKELDNEELEVDNQSFSGSGNKSPRLQRKYGGTSSMQNSQSNLSEQRSKSHDFYSYAQQKELLEQTAHETQNMLILPKLRPGKSFDIKKSQIEKSNFHSIIKNLNKNLNHSKNSLNSSIMTPRSTMLNISPRESFMSGSKNQFNFSQILQDDMHSQSRLSMLQSFELTSQTKFKHAQNKNFQKTLSQIEPQLKQLISPK